MGFSLKKLVKGFDKKVGVALLDPGALQRKEDEKKKQAAKLMAAQQNQAAQDAATRAANLQRNLTEDLSLDNIANVEASGTAYTSDVTAGLKKKKTGAAQLASTLGIRA